MAYTPELSYRGSATLQRLIWFRGKPIDNLIKTFNTKEDLIIISLLVRNQYEPILRLVAERNCFYEERRL